MAVDMGLHDTASGQFKREVFFGGGEIGAFTAGPRSYDGAYTSLEFAWREHRVRVETLAEGTAWWALITPLATPSCGGQWIVRGGMVWNRPGRAWRDDETLCIESEAHAMRVRCSRSLGSMVFADLLGPYLAVPLEEPFVLSTTDDLDLAGLRARMDRARDALTHHAAQYGEQAELYEAFQTCLAWDTIYDFERQAVISPVSRLWNCAGGGPVLFDWDTYFAAYLAAIDHPDLAFANSIEVTRPVRACGFVPNYANGNTSYSYDRSQPPVGAMIVWEVYRHHPQRWYLEEVYDDLLTWNRWWPDHRCAQGDYLCWGSSPHEPCGRWIPNANEVNQRFGGALESGLDNSPMYDDTPFDADQHILLLADVGLMGLYIRDCRALARIAEELGRTEEAEELRARAERFGSALQTLWDEETGLFLNKRLDTGAFEHRLSPTHFYPLLSGVPTLAQAERMVNEHLLNPEEFWGEWVIPSIARNDPTYVEQNYWRGPIWGPMNFLVYLGLCNYDLPDARARLAERSAALLLNEWRQRRLVRENYSPENGTGDSKGQSDPFYHWGGLLGMIALIEHGQMQMPQLYPVYQ